MVAREHPGLLEKVRLDSTILVSLSVDTVVGLVQRLPRHLLQVVVESEGLHHLVSTAPEDRRAKEWLEGVTPELVAVLEGEELARLPEYLLEYAVTSTSAVTALLEFPEKLEVVAREHPGLLEKVRSARWCFCNQPLGFVFTWVPVQVSAARVSEVVAKLPDTQLLLLAHHPRLVLLLPDAALLALLARRPHLLRRLPRGALGRLLRAPVLQGRLPRLLRLLPAPALARLATSRPWLVTSLPSSTLVAMVARSDLRALLSDQALANLLVFRPSLLTELPAPLVVELVEGRPALLDALPPAAEPGLQQLLLARGFVARLPARLDPSPSLTWLTPRPQLAGHPRRLTHHPAPPHPGGYSTGAQGSRTGHIAP